MQVAALLKKMQNDGTLEASRAGLLLDMHEKRILSVHRELHVLLYAGILLVVAGAGWTVKTYFASLGDLAVISALSLCTAAAFLYCFRKGLPFDRGPVTSSGTAFDYVLFFGCAFFAMDLAYMEIRFGILGAAWKHSLLFSTALFAGLAYRYDNRLVLSLALSTLAAWFGFTLSDYRFFSFDAAWRFYGMAYAIIVFTGGFVFFRLGIKKHFFGIWLNFAIHILCLALLSGVFDHKILSLYFPALVGVCILVAVYALRTRQFLYLLFAMGYGYIGLSVVIVDAIERHTVLIFTYFILSSLTVIGGIIRLSRRFKERP